MSSFFYLIYPHSVSRWLTSSKFIFWNGMERISDAAAAKSLQSCPTLCDPIDGSPLCSCVPGILQARTLEWVAISFSNAWKWKVKVKSLSRVQLCNPMDCNQPGSSIHGIFEARVLEWGAIAFSEWNLYAVVKDEHLVQQISVGSYVSVHLCCSSVEAVIWSTIVFPLDFFYLDIIYIST